MAKKPTNTNAKTKSVIDDGNKLSAFKKRSGLQKFIDCTGQPKIAAKVILEDATESKLEKLDGAPLMQACQKIMAAHFAKNKATTDQAPESELPESNAPANDPPPK